MLISRKSDKSFYNILVYNISKYLKTSYISVFSGDTISFSMCKYSSDDKHIYFDVPITYVYKYKYTDGRYYTFGVRSTSCVAISIVPVSISHGNTLALGISLDNPTYTVNTDSLIDPTWDSLVDEFKGVDNVPFTKDYLLNQIYTQFHGIDNTSVSLKNTIKYSRLPKWVNTAKFIPLVFWDTDSYRVRFARCSDPVRLSKWYNPEDFETSMYDAFVHSMIYELFIKFIFQSSFFYAT